MDMYGYESFPYLIAMVYLIITDRLHVLQLPFAAPAEVAAIWPTTGTCRLGACRLGSLELIMMYQHQCENEE